MSLSCYVVQVAANMEDSVQNNIALTIVNKLRDLYANNDVEQMKLLFKTFGIENIEYSDFMAVKEYLLDKIIIVPKEKVEELRNGKKRETERKIFSGYVLVYMLYNDDYGLLIRKVNKVRGFIGVGKDLKPVPISNHELDSILNQVSQSQEKARYKVEFFIGEVVRIIDGPFVDFNAVIDEVIYPKSKLKVNVQIFGRDTLVELDFMQVEKNN